MSVKNLGQETNETNGIKILLGDPKKAIIKLSIPTIIGMFFQMVYNLIDAVWISGKGTNALSAIGFFFPFFIFLLAIANGIGIGGAAALSRQIGAKNIKNANDVAEHTIVLSIVAAILLTIPAIIFVEPIFRFIGAGAFLAESVEYARIMFYGIILIFFSTTGNALLRGEGDAKRAMKLMVLGPVLNAIFAPFLIYKIYIFTLFDTDIEFGFNMGIKGAAIATLLSIFICCMILVYWLFIRNKSFITFNYKSFKFNKTISKIILKVGIPTSLSQMSMSIMMGILTVLVFKVDRDSGVAIFTTAWRFALIAIIPLLGISAATVSVFGAAHGSNEKDKLDTAYLFAIKMGLIIEGVIAILTFLLAPFISNIFTWSKETMGLTSQITSFLRVLCLFFPVATGGFITAAMFQGAGKGLYSLTITFLRTIVLIVPAAYIFGIVFKMNILGINIGTILGSLFASIISYILARLFIRNQTNVGEEL